MGVPDTSKPPPSQQPYQQQQNENRRRPSSQTQQQQQQQNRDRGWEKRDLHEYRPANSANYAKGRGNNNNNRGMHIVTMIFFQHYFEILIGILKTNNIFFIFFCH